MKFSPTSNTISSTKSNPTSNNLTSNLPTFSLHLPILNSFNQNSNLFSPLISDNLVPKELTSTSSSVYDSSLQVPQSLDQHFRPNYANGLSQSGTSNNSPTVPFFKIQPNVLNSGVKLSNSSPELTILPTFTSSIGFDYPNQPSAISFSPPDFLPQELSPIQKITQVFNISPSTLKFPNIKTSTSSLHSSSLSWDNFNSPTVNQFPTTYLNSSNSLSPSDPPPSNSTSRSWTPENVDNLNSSTRFSDPSNGPQSFPPLESPVTIEPLSTSFFDHHTQISSPVTLYSHQIDTIPRGLLSQDSIVTPPLINQSNHLSQLITQNSLYQYSQSFSPTYPLSIGSTPSRPINHQTSSRISSPLTPHSITLSGTPTNISQDLCGISPNRFESQLVGQLNGHSSKSKQDSIQNSSLSNTTPLPLGAQLGSSQKQFHHSNMTINSSENFLGTLQFSSPEINSPFLLSPGTSVNSKASSLSSSRLEGLVITVNSNITNPTNKKKRELKEAEAICGVCGGWMARLTLRGTAEELSVSGGYDTIHTCQQCHDRKRGGVPLSLTKMDQTINPPFSEPRQVTPSEIRPPRINPQSSSQIVVTTFRKRNRRTDDVTAPTTCDCCARQLGVGGIVPRNGRSAIQFAVEVVCVHCVRNFRRCTDCGGGGGSRLGVGKWRCKELFSDGRRTCILSHQRQGASNEVRNVVWRLSELIGKLDLDTLVGQIKELVKHSLYAALATPEMLESGLARVSTFEDIKNMYSNGWKQIEPLICEDVENQLRRRRYISLRWTKPHPRKGPKRLTLLDRCNEITSLRNEVNGILEHGKELSGFILAEWDMNHGTFFVSVAMPWQSGDALESTAALANKTYMQALADRKKLINDLINHGMSREEANKNYPPIQHLWTILFFSREARLVQFLEKRRKFMPLEEYLIQYPDAKRTMFPPERDCYVPMEEQKDWHVWVRRESGLGPTNLRSC
ncbi:hypothetical protein O181_048592 [Austropuccinia psidii MF-1]|uniref:Uncharacterized protein n=1 Tax=Austropuccinia psidii MF-1 TaxID=1389203 RepID=A0A9Q3E061_9BASI|nr:hypothetical protein [Austropuccinia psidii MF-1]